MAFIVVACIGMASDEADRSGGLDCMIPAAMHIEGHGPVMMCLVMRTDIKAPNIGELATAVQTSPDWCCAVKLLRT